ncbi:MAG: hypothetical protein A2Y76_00280 [Planctomycetes bacterium RBG_13_60_9]|nr:MAG: hypothetical protein A2Y76_00280 [Planctomycetes bacterium RBG_13_60_9]
MPDIRGEKKVRDTFSGFGVISMGRRFCEGLRVHLRVVSWRLWNWYVHLWKLALVALGMIFIILLLAHILSLKGVSGPLMATILGNFLAKHEQMLPLVGLAKDVILTGATIVAGIWSYYVFIKGRTFRPRLSINVRMHYVCGRRRDVAVVRVSIRNEGRTRIRPALAQAAFSYGILSENGVVEFRPFHVVENMLDEYYRRTERFALEPQDEMHIDVPVPLSLTMGSELLTQDTTIGIHVKIKVWDIGYRCWQENAILQTSVSEV